MAKMKHMKQPESGSKPKSTKLSSYKLPGDKPPRGARPPRVSIGGDRAFKAALAEEFGVTEVPRRLQRRTAKTLEDLPDSLPVRQRPVLWAVKSAATVMAVLAVTFAALLGLNTTHPQLTEALPGLGRVFASMNGHDTPDPSPTPAPTPTPQPEFQPVMVLNRGDFPGVFTVDNAWSDGHTLLLDLSVSPYGGVELGNLLDQYPGGTSYDYLTLYPAVIQYNDFGENYPEYTGILTVSSDGDSRDFKGSFDAFQPDGTGKLTACWQLDLDGMAVGPELSVSMSLPDICAFFSLYDRSGSMAWEAGFEAEFTVPVASGVNRALSVQSADGPVTLQAVDYSPSHVELDVSVPYLGMVGDLFADMDSDLPLGIYARLTCMDGSYEYETDGPSSDSRDTVKLIPDGSTRLDLHYVFRAPSAWNSLHPQDLRGPLTLTIYELPQQKEHIGRVLAEFTIDMSTGRAYPGENYIKDGYEKGDAQKTTAQRLEEVSYDGFLLLLTTENADEAISNGQFTISAPLGSAGRELTVNCYLDDEIAYDFTFVLGGGDSDDEYGWYSTGTYYLPSTGQEYISTTVSVNYPDWLFEQYGGDGSFDRLKLTDAASGEVLIPDLRAAWWETIEQLLGANPYKSEYGSQESSMYDY